MNQEKIGKAIKTLRTKNHLTQAELADKLGVTYQAVSKWENGKNIPDVAILKQISQEFHIPLEALLEGQIPRMKKKKIWIVFFLILFILFLFLLFLFLSQKSSSFEFRTLSSGCDNFDISGSLAYNEKKSCIYISNIDYCKGDDTKEYVELSCHLYEVNGNTKTEISRYLYNDTPITLEKFLSEVSFHIDDYAQTCDAYSENSLFLEIDATEESGKTTTYKVPLSLQDRCEKTSSTQS